MQPPTQQTAIRSFLFTPGNHARRVEKVFQTETDAVILDLEDAVAIAEKEATRAVIVEAFASRPESSCLRYVRINGMETPYSEDDVSACVGAWLHGVVVPKVERAEQLHVLDERITRAEKAAGLEAGSIDLMPIIETAKGVEYATEIALAVPRVTRLAFGGGDYTLDLDYQWTADEDVLSYARSRLSHASRVANIAPPIDTVVLQIKDNDRFRASADRGRKFGFGGKLCIHPDQVPLANAAFTPTEEEIEHARDVVAAFEAAEAQGSASIQLDGYFIDYPIVYKSQRILNLAAILGQ